ncbi:FHA domain-containing protein [Geothrix sp. 21YS21S-4]|uniref:FHA domain-containing protein n=1 Tax=Geothrix sp. 21YS21S-4 TaxID=3068889 RepID=UPI0027BA7662|nr:FHA domain-containing protein [Geothrix sp. 21YS21S-4]
MAKLLVHESAGVRTFEIVDEEVHMGRELDNTLRLPDPSISRHHCVLRKAAGGGYEIQDLESSNGVLVNGSRVQTSPLRDGDRITLGQIQLTFQDPRPEASPTVAISVPNPVPVPSGTVRMSADELAAIHTGPPPADPPAAPPAPRPAPPFPPVAPAVPTPLPPGPSEQSFLGSLLPSLPDDAVPTGERGDLGTRLLAILIDVVPGVLIYIACIFLTFIPYLGCILWPLQFIAYAAYYWLFIPWCVSKYGASIGKKAMKLRVVPEGEPRGRIGFGPAVLRQIGNFLFLNVIVLLIKGDERISLSDLLAKSEVLKVDR